MPKRDFRQTLKQTLVTNIEDKPAGGEWIGHPPVSATHIYTL